MLRKVLGVIVGYAVWTAIWLGGNALFFGAAAEQVEADVKFADPLPLVGLLALSVVCSLAAGFAVGWICRGRGFRASIVLGALLLITGIGVQFGVWALMPVWYHLIFLVLLVPATMVGSRLAPGALSTK